MKNDQPFQLLSHHPQGLKGDKLGYKTYAETISTLLNELQPGNTGLTIGIFGGWGTGKSSILKMLSEQLESRDKCEDFLVVEFDAWRYAKQEELWLALLRRIIDQVERRLGFWESLEVNWQLRK